MRQHKAGAAETEKETKTMQLSENFTREEFELEGPMPEESVPAFTFLCVNILEPTRRQFGQPMKVTSGHRTPEGNADAHGNAHSEHVSTANWCAADWEIPGWADLRGVFDWIRLNSGLPFHIVTLEHQVGGADVIHISWNADADRAARVAKEGATHNSTGYIEWTVA
jgi:peptidase M15-like protein